MNLYLKVTTDEYELPLAVAGSVRELAKMCDVRIDTIYSSMSHFKHGQIVTSPYRKVEIDSMDDDE